MATDVQTFNQINIMYKYKALTETYRIL